MLSLKLKFKHNFTNDYIFNHFQISLNVIFFPYNRIAVLKILPENFIIAQQLITKIRVVNKISINSTLPVPNRKIIIKGVIGGR